MNNIDITNLSKNRSGTGYIIIRTSTAMGAIPVIGAIVNISGADKENSDIIISLRSDRNGTTEKISLPAPSKRFSSSPGNTLPYSLYNLEVFAEGFYTRNYVNIPIFDGITSYQSVELIPLSANQYSDNYTQSSPIVNETFPPNL